MPGFGSGPFGSSRFGEWDWARRVLFDSLPEIYRRQDALEGDPMQKFALALKPSFDRIRESVRDFLDLRDPFRIRTQYDKTATLRLGTVVSTLGELEQRGVTGTIDSLQQFSAPTARFSSSDIGKELTISASVTSSNNRTYMVASVVNSSTVVIDPLPTTDTGPLTWELRPKVDAATDRLTVQVRSGDVSEVAPGWEIFDGYANFKVLARRQFLNLSAEQKLLTEQEALDGEIDGSGRFKSTTIRLTQRDVGKRLSLKDAAVVENDGVYEITSLVTVGPGDVRAVINASPVLTASTAIKWALLPFPELDLEGLAIPEGIVEQEGTDLTITAVTLGDATVSCPTAVFSAADVGKYLTIRGSTGTNDSNASEITAFLSTTSVKIAQKVPAFTVEVTPMTWELRTTALTSLGVDTTYVTARAPSLITFLAPDFGIDLDTQDSENRQRGWVAHVNQWIPKKGTHEAYRIVAALSGFSISTSALFRISSNLFPTIPDAHEFDVAETGTGKSGTSGTLSLVGTRYRFTDPAAVFTATDVGKHIKVTTAATGGNNKRYTIETILSATSVEFTGADSASLPDANNGTLDWTMVRVYTDLPPSLPRFDEIRGDLLTNIINTTSGGTFFFSADRYCWEETFDTTCHVEVTSVTTTAPGVHRVECVGTSAFPDAPEVVTGIGNWKLMSLTAGATIGTGDSLAFSGHTVTLTDAAAAFTTALIGQWIKITGATTPANNGTFLVTGVPSATTLTYINGLGVAEAFPGTYTVYSSRDFFLTSVPALTGGTSGGLPIYWFEVRAQVAPTATGPAKLRYVCPVQTSCDYCQARQVRAVLTATAALLAEGGAAVERMQERVTIRLQDVTPAHVELVISFV